MSDEARLLYPCTFVLAKMTAYFIASNQGRDPLAFGYLPADRAPSGASLPMNFDGNGTCGKLLARPPCRKSQAEDATC